MRKETRIQFRVDDDFKNTISSIAGSFGVPVSEFFTKLAEKAIDDNKDELKDNLRKIFEKYIIRKNRRMLCSDAYITKNMYSRIMDFATSDFFITQDVNMRLINKLLDSYVAEFETYDEKTQKVIGSEFKVTVKKLRSKDFVLGYFDKYKLLKYISRK